MARRKRKNGEVKSEQLTMDFDPREKNTKLPRKSRGLTLQDIEEMLDYYKYYGEYACVEFGQIDLIKLGKECLRLRELLEEITETDDINRAKEIAKGGLIESKKF